MSYKLKCCVWFDLQVLFNHLSQGSFVLTGWTIGTLVTSVWTATTLCCCVRPASSLQTCPSPLTCSAPSCLKAPPSSRSYRCACPPLNCGCCWFQQCTLLQLFCLDVTERDRLPVGLRGFGRRPSQYDQREADAHVRSAVPPPPEPAGAAAPHRHPGELQVFWYSLVCFLLCRTAWLLYCALSNKY